MTLSLSIIGSPKPGYCHTIIKAYIINLLMPNIVVPMNNAGCILNYPVYICVRHDNIQGNIVNILLYTKNILSPKDNIVGYTNNIQGYDDYIEGHNDNFQGNNDNIQRYGDNVLGYNVYISGQNNNIRRG